jgi:hypothetical protein
MNYAKVESSQIAEVGYGDGLYGPETLALRFPPNKKQAAAGEAGSEYHYGNITPEQHQALMGAESIGFYFGKNIKPFPDKYPFTKVEADPQQPSVGAASNTQAAQEDTNGDQPSPGSALALIDGMADDKLFAPGSITDAQLATMRTDWLTEAKKYDISTDKARTELKRFARPLQKLRTGIEARAKELTGATKRKIAAIDTEKRRLVQVVGGIEEEVLAPLTAWEQEEETRKARLSGFVEEFANRGQVHLYPDAVSLGAAIYELENADLSSMQEYKLSAESAIAASLKVLKPELERRKVAEANEKELEALRAAEAKRQEDARIAAAAQKLADEQTQARLDAAVEAAKAETRQEVIAELAAPVEVKAPEGSLARQFDDAEEAAEKFAEVEIYETAATREDYLKQVHDEIVEAFMCCALTRQEAIAVLKAIIEGRVPHVTIQY